MQLPSGISEEYFVATVNAIANVLSKPFSFGYYDPGDIRQECFVEAIKALPRYDTSKGMLSTFLSNHLRNRLINLRRDKLVRKQTPCMTCQKCELEIDKQFCKKYQKWKKRNEFKQALMESSSVDDEGNLFTEYSTDGNSVENTLLRQELVNLIDKHMPVKLRADYRRFVEGVKLPNKRKQKIIEYIKNILINENYGEENQTE